MYMEKYIIFQLCYGVTIAAGASTRALSINLTEFVCKQSIRAIETQMSLEQFLKQVEKRAFRIAQIATSDVEEALDIVQDAMMILASRYATRDAEEWPPLFHRILQNRIRDWYRRQKVRNTWRSWFGSHDEEGEGIQGLQDKTAFEPDRLLDGQQAVAALEQALQTLPLRQQQTFLLRAWEGMDVKETAKAMGISTGSVKTHYSRALHTLRQQLETASDE